MSREVKLASELVAQVRSGSLGIRQAIEQLPVTFLDQASLGLDVDPASGDVVRCVPAGPGAATGEVAFSIPEAFARANDGEKVILAITETFPEDIETMKAVRGVIAVSGGLTGHAAIVSRGLRKPCVCGGSGVTFTTDAASGERALRVEPTSGAMRQLAAGDVVSFDGCSGLLVIGVARLAPLGPEIDRLLGWCLAIADGKPPEDAPPASLVDVAQNLEPVHAIARARRALGLT